MSLQQIIAILLDNFLLYDDNLSSGSRILQNHFHFYGLVILSDRLEYAYDALQIGTSECT